MEGERGKKERERYEGRQQAYGNTERGERVNGKGRRERSEGCVCKKGVDGRKRGRGKCHGLQNLRNGDGLRGKGHGARVMWGMGHGAWGIRQVARHEG